ncbi:hypothetical protein RFI_09684 [Reticulomyxa filosa]|uniref:Uncharacterized protein n=1 Tax=Reticulomyxa filosa TaxID=46433 RepID=X6NNF0_RETFI|nr:hypothetical protein RFI_09684 [Reticulomyxa filosa]|eukprot:ETO27448.1 hypothetical protein RFI_09684 [Reticulomyxa filosa]
MYTCTYMGNNNNNNKASGIPYKEIDMDKMDREQKLAKRTQHEKKQFEKYIDNLERQTQWDIQINYGGHKIVQKMAKSLGFHVTKVERVQYGPFHIDVDFHGLWSGHRSSNSSSNDSGSDDNRKSITTGNKQQFIRGLNELFLKDANTNVTTFADKADFEKERNKVRKKVRAKSTVKKWNDEEMSNIKRLADYNSTQLSELQVQKLWECVGGEHIGVTLHLQSLLNRAIATNDQVFWNWLSREYGIKV